MHRLISGRWIILNKLYMRYAKSSMIGFHTVVALVSCIFYIIGDIFGMADHIRTGKIIFFIGIISYLVHLNQHHFYRYINQSENISNFPEEEIRLKNNLFLFGFLVIAAAAMFIFLLLPTEELTEIIKNFFSYIAGVFTRWILGIFNYSGKRKNKDFDLTEKMDKNFDFASKPENDSGGSRSPFWALVFDMFIKIVSFAVIAALSICLIYIIYKKFSEVIKRKRKYAEVREFILPEMLREGMKNKETKKEGRLFLDMSPNGRMRKLYIQRVKKAGKKGMRIPGSYTPEEIENFAGLAEDEDRAGLHECYEKARYSKNGCNGTEIRELKGRR